MKSQRRWPGVVANLAIATAATVVALGVAELALRTLTPQQLGFAYKDGKFQKPIEFFLFGNKNNLGFHDEEPGPKRPGVFRILLLGDSYVESLSTPVDATVGARTEAHLNESGGDKFDVVSVGLSGWGQKQELRALEKHGPALHPDLVVTLFLVFNDVRNNNPWLERRAFDQYYRMERFRPGWIRLRGEDAPVFWFEGSVLNQMISYRLAVSRSRRADPEIPIDYLVYAEEYDRRWLNAWNTTRRLLRETRDVAHRMGARYAIVSATTRHGVLGPNRGLAAVLDNYPQMRGGSWDLDKPDRILSRFARNQGIPLLTLEPRFREIVRENGEALHWKFDGHWNMAGADAAGRAIAVFLREHGLLTTNRQTPR